MRTAEWINLLFFSFLSVLSCLMPLERSRRARIITIGAVALGLVLLMRLAEWLLPPLPQSVLRDWLPAPLLLAAYWQGGQFFTRAMEGWQSTLARIDQRLLGPLLRWPRKRGVAAYLAAYFEIAYVFCYPMVPLGLGALYILRMGRYADLYWTAILPPTYLCYAMLPFIQTLPPRMLAARREAAIPKTPVRSLNLWILRHASIQVNTFPSAHVTTAIAIALVLLRLAPPVGIAFLWIAISITIGCVIGRYHYAIDALLGIALALAVFFIERIRLPL